MIKLITNNSLSTERIAILDKLSQINFALNIIEHDDYELYFELTESDLIIHHRVIGSISINGLYKPILIRHQRASHELIVQLLKPKKVVEGLVIWDLTGGLGQDSILISSLGYPVTIVEQNMHLAFILHYASIVGLLPNNINVVWANSLEFLSRDIIAPNIIYLDPMFKDHKNAKSKKNMQLIQQLVGNDKLDDQELFIRSINVALDKVIVKRDNKQAIIHDGYKVSYFRQGKTVRYDVYQVTKKIVNETVN